MDEAAFTDWTLPLFNRGMLRGEALSRNVNAQLGNRLIVLVGVGSADFASKRQSIAAGRRAMQRLLPQLKAAIAARTH